jgi:hypothetical protein
VPLTTIFDVTPEDILKTIEDVLLSIKIKAIKDSKKSVSLINVQGSSQTGGLGLGEGLNRYIKYKLRCRLKL